MQIFQPNLNELLNRSVDGGTFLLELLDLGVDHLRVFVKLLQGVIDEFLRQQIRFGVLMAVVVFGDAQRADVKILNS